MSSKSIYNCKVGDKVIIGNHLYTITKESKTQFTCTRDGTEQTERITKHGKVVGGGYNSHWAHVLETTPEVFYAAIEAKAAQKKSEADARAQAWNDKISLVRGRNSDGHIIITDEGMGGLKKAVLVDSQDRPMIVYFSVQPEQYYINYSQPPVDGVRIRATTWRDDGWQGEVRYGFSHTDARGATIEDALIELVAGHYWN